MIEQDEFRPSPIAGWAAKVEPYHGFFGPITSQIADALLDAARVRAGTRVLDLATGPGYVATRAAARRARVVAVDLTARMLALARQLHPTLEFAQVDAEQLPFADHSSDAVVGNFVPTLGRPERAESEVMRVPAPGGRLAFSTWDAPERSRLSGVFEDAAKEAGVVAPAESGAGMPFLRLTSGGQLSELLRSAGFEEIEVRRISFTQHLASADDWWCGVLAGTVRTSALILRQPQDVQRKIRLAFDRLTREYAKDGGLEIPVSVRIASGRQTSQT